MESGKKSKPRTLEKLTEVSGGLADFEQIYLLSCSIPSILFLIMSIITSFLMQTSAINYETCRLGSTSEHLRSHLRGSVVVGFVIALGKLKCFTTVYMNILFKGI